MTRLKKPNLENTEPQTKSAFVREAKPAKLYTQPTSFQLTPHYKALFEVLCETTGQKRINVLKAALLAFEDMDSSEQDKWCLEAIKKK
ncbi:hypothetical protein ACCB74_003704 [Escherichia coli]